MRSGIPSFVRSSAAATNIMMKSSSVSKPLVIFCHGSGDTGAGAQAWIEHLVPQHSVLQTMDWVFPSATPRPYSLNGGITTSVWFDRIGGFAPTFPEQTESIEESCNQLLELIQNRLEEDPTLHPSQIALAGFSMGGAMALQTTARWQAYHAAEKGSLGAVVGMSCYLNNDSHVWDLLSLPSSDKSEASASNWPPVWMAHGELDDFVLPEWGHATYTRLQASGVVNASFRQVPYTHHDMTPTEIAEVIQFISDSLNDDNKKKQHSTVTADTNNNNNAQCQDQKAQNRET